MPTKRSRVQRNYGSPGGLVSGAPYPIIQPRAPRVTDDAEIGTLWVDTDALTSYILCGFDGGEAQWETSPSGGTTATSFTINPGDLTVTTRDVIITAGDLDMNAGSTASLGTLVAGATTLGSLDVTVNAEIGGDLHIIGDVTIDGDFDISSIDALSINTTSNTAGAITLQTNGGTAETIIIRNVQGTGGDAIGITSTVGGMTLTSGLADPAAIYLRATDAAGGVTTSAGTGGITLTTVNGPFELETGTGDIDIGADGAAHDIVIGNSTGATSISLDTGTGNSLNLGTNPIAHTVTIGNITTTTAVNVNTGTGGSVWTTTNGVFTVATGTGTITLDGTGAQAINIGVTNAIKTIAIGGAAANVITIGNTQTAGSIAMGTAMTTGTVSIGGTGLQTGNFILAPSTAAQAITLANNNGAKTISIGNGIDGNTISIGNGINTSAQTISIAGGASAASSTVNILSGAATAGTSTLNLGTGNYATGKTVNIATGTGANTTNIQSGTNTAAQVTNIQSGASGADATVNILSGNKTAGTSTVNIATGTGNKVVHIADGAGANTVTIGTQNTTSTLILSAGDGGIALNASGLVSVDSTISAAGATPRTVNTNVGQAIFTGITTAVGGQDPVVINNSLVTANSVVLATASNPLNGKMGIVKVLCGAGTITLTVQNFDTVNAMTGNLMINFWVLEA